MRNIKYNSKDYTHYAANAEHELTFGELHIPGGGIVQIKEGRSWVDLCHTDFVNLSFPKKTRIRVGAQSYLKKRHKVIKPNGEILTNMKRDGKSSAKSMIDAGLYAQRQKQRLEDWRRGIDDFELMRGRIKEGLSKPDKAIPHPDEELLEKDDDGNLVGTLITAEQAKVLLEHERAGAKPDPDPADEAAE